jgi:hypothetical protein
VTSGEHIRGFGIEQFGEIVSKISGKITGVPLTFTKYRKRAAHVTRQRPLGQAAAGQYSLRADKFAESFKVTLARTSGVRDELDFSELAEVVKDEPQGARLPALRAGRIQMFGDAAGAEPLSRKVPAGHWLTAGVSEEAVHYFYWQGQWYEIGAEYLATVESRIAPRLSRERHAAALDRFRRRRKAP